LIIDKVRLTNFQFTKNIDINFQKGFNVIIGENGSGKSSIFNSFPYLLNNHIPKTIEDLLNWDAETFNAYIHFSHENIPYSIENSFERKTNKTDKILTIGTTEKIKGATPVNERLYSLFDPSLCKASMIHTQGENDVVKATPTDRRENLKKIYNLDFSSQAEALENDIASLTIKITALEKDILILENKEYLFKVIPDLVFSEEEYNDWKESLIVLKEKLSIIQQRKNEYESNLAKQIKTVNDIKSYEVIVQKDIDSISTTQIVIEDAEKFLSSDISIRISSLKSELDSFKIKSKEEEEELSNRIQKIILSRPPLSLEKEIKEKTDELRKSQYMLSSAEKSYENKLNGKCSECGRPYHSEDLEETRVIIEDLKLSIPVLEKDVSGLEDRQKVVQEKLLEGQRLLQEKNNLITSLATMVSTHEKEIIARQKIIESELSSVEMRKALIENNRAKIADLLCRLSSDQTILDEKKVTLKELDSLLLEKVEIPDEITSAIVVKEGLIKKYEETLILITSYEQHNKEAEKQKILDEEKLIALKKDKDALVEDVEMWKRGIIIFKKELPNFIISQMSKEIEDGMNLFLDKTYKGRYHVKIAETKNGLAIVYGKREKEISLASGAEQSLFQLATKIAFTQISGLKVLILDEIDAYMSTSITETVIRVLYDMLDKEELNQIFIITHNDTIKQKFEFSYGSKIIEIADGRII